MERSSRKTVHKKFNDIPGCETDIDDILIWGRTINKHNLCLEQVLNRVQEINMTLSREKCQFRQMEVTYLSVSLTQQGFKPDGDKRKVIRDYVKPTNKQDVQRLLGMVNFIAKFAPRVSDVTTSLRELIKKNIAFHWLDTHNKAFEELKLVLMDSETLRYYDVMKGITLQVRVPL